jgi:hypothetical protein
MVPTTLVLPLAWGGPFETATTIFEARADRAKFPTAETTIRKMMANAPDHVEGILKAVREFPEQLKALAGQLSNHDRGPFPTYHHDLYNSKMVVDQGFEILGIIDWQDASIVPWGLIDFLFCMTVTPRPMGPPSNYDADGLSKDPDLKFSWDKRQSYVEMVKVAEVRQGKDHGLSNTLGILDIQGLATAMKLYHDPGKLGYYVNVLIPFRKT